VSVQATEEGAEVLELDNDDDFVVSASRPQSAEGEHARNRPSSDVPLIVAAGEAAAGDNADDYSGLATAYAIEETRQIISHKKDYRSRRIDRSIARQSKES
jgi:hypothetical protein